MEPRDWLSPNSPNVDADDHQKNVLQSPNPYAVDLKDFHRFVAA